MSCGEVASPARPRLARPSLGYTNAKVTDHDQPTRPFEQVHRCDHCLRAAASASIPRDDLLKFVLNDAVPALHQGRTTIAKARAEVAERRSKLKVEGPDKTDVAAAFRRMENQDTAEQYEA
jgi:hypothetical protein